MTYGTGVLLGTGGMGEVYRAFDSKLSRNVALKFLRREGPGFVERLQREARLQARVEHENVCRVYEVGEVDGRPYIAMQYVEGRTLDAAAPEMSREQRVRLMQQVSDAVHAAHRTGLIHRDIKPRNIMVEHREEAFRPVVMDFGLARESEGTVSSLAGLAIGTPPYMAPEQARGDQAALDRRTDVYALGAVLYELLAGRPLFDGTSAVELLLRIVQEEPEPLRKVVPGIAADLETIVMRCLEKEPGRRYETARALAEDLGRYLDGEPILAQRPSALSTLARRARKHRLAVAAASAGAIAILAALGLWVRTARLASVEAQAAQRFGQEVERVEGTLRQAHLLPLHDTRPERALVRRRMAHIESEMARIGPAAKGPGHYALGRGYLALHDHARARDHLEIAWNLAYRPPELAYALGVVYGTLYQQALGALDGIEDRGVRAARRKSLEALYRAPAAASLRSAKGLSGETPAYAEALLAFFEKGYPTALAKARDALRQSPGLYEAWKLQGDVYVETQRDKQLRSDFDSALADLARAGEAYREALLIARSDATVYLGEAARLESAGILETNRGGPADPFFASAAEAVELALKADPASGDALSLKANLYSRWAELERSLDRDPSRRAAESVDAAEAAVRLDPGASAARVSLAESLLAVSRYQGRHGSDPRPGVARALEQLALAAERNPQAETFSASGRAHRIAAQWELGHGRDPRPELREAVACYDRAGRIDPAFPYAHNNAGNSYELIAAWEMRHGLDPSRALRSAAAAYEKAIALSPRFAYAYNNLASAHWDEAQYRMARGEDPRPALANAVAGYERAFALDPSFAEALMNVGEARWTEGRYLAGTGRDPGPSLAAGLSAIRRATSLQPGAPEAFLTEARIHLVGAEWDSGKGRDPEAALEKVFAAANRALAGDSKNASAFEVMAEGELLRARIRERRGRPGGECVNRGLRDVERCLSLDAETAEALAVRGELLLVRARSERDAAPRLAACRGARASLEAAISINPLLKRDHARALSEAEALASSAGTPR